MPIDQDGDAHVDGVSLRVPSGGTVGIAWALVLIATVFGLFGPLFGLPEWTTRISPLAVTPIVADGSTDLRGTWWLVLVVVAGAAASLALMRRRELQTAG